MAGVPISVILAALGLHHGEADPTLLQWIMAALSHILIGSLGLTELTVVIIIGLIILAMPGAIVLSYWASTRSARSTTPPPRIAVDRPAPAEADE